MRSAKKNTTDCLLYFINPENISTMKIELSDDLKSNFRSWEQGCDDIESATMLANILKERHPRVAYEDCLEWATWWTGYNDGLLLD